MRSHAQRLPAQGGQESYLVGRNPATALWPQLSLCRTPGGQPVQPGQPHQLSLWHVQSYMGIKRPVSRESMVLITHGQVNQDLGREMFIMIMAQHRQKRLLGILYYTSQLGRICSVEEMDRTDTISAG